MTKTERYEIAKELRKYRRDLLRVEDEIDNGSTTEISLLRQQRYELDSRISKLQNELEA